MGLSLVTAVGSFLIACSYCGPAQAAYAPVIEAIHGRTLLSNCPHWDPATAMLYFVDIHGKSVHRYDCNSTLVTSVDLGECVTMVIPILGEKDKFLITLEQKIAIMCWDGVSPRPTFVKVLGIVGKPYDGTFVSVGKADANGVLWAGTTVVRNIDQGDFVPDAAVLFSLSKWRSPQVHVTGLSFPLGLTWNRDNTQLYVSDFATAVIHAFDIDLDRSLITKPREIFDFKAKRVAGSPGGMTIDTDGRIWVACMGAGQVIQIDPETGNLLRTVSIPSIKVTSVTFGGTDLDQLFVTSESLNIPTESLHKYQAPGCVFRVLGLGAQGLPANRVTL